MVVVVADTTAVVGGGAAVVTTRVAGCRFLQQPYSPIPIQQTIHTGIRICSNKAPTPAMMIGKKPAIEEATHMVSDYAMKTA